MKRLDGQPRSAPRNWDEEPYRSQLIEALRSHYGNIKAMSKDLHCDKDLMRKRVENDPELRKVRDQAYAGIYNKAVDALAKRVEEGNMSAIALVMRISPWARKQGWGDHIKVSGDGDNRDLAAQAREIFGLASAARPGEEAPPEK